MAATQITYTRSRYLKTGLGNLGGKAESAAGEIALEVRIPLAASESNQEIAIAWAHASVLAMGFDLEKNDTTSTVVPTTVTLKSNSTSSPGDTVTIKYNQNFDWVTGDAATKPFSSANVTKLYATNDAAVAVVLSIAVLLDQA